MTTNDMKQGDRVRTHTGMYATVLEGPYANNELVLVSFDDGDINTEIYVNELEVL